MNSKRVIAVFFVLLSIVPLSVVGQSVQPTIRSTPQGGSWSNATTWEPQRVPTSADQVEINGLVELDQDFTVAGLAVSGILRARSRGLRLTVLGNAENAGTITHRLGSEDWTLTIHGAILNEEPGSIEGRVQILVYGNITNNGEWIASAFGPTQLLGTEPRFITGDQPITGSVELGSSLEIQGQPLLDSGFWLAGHTLTVNAPSVVTVRNIGGGELAGSGRLEITGDQTGSVSGSIAEVRLVNGGNLDGSLDVPRVVNASTRLVSDINIGGDLLLEPGANLLPRFAPRQVTVNGNLVNRGRIDDGNSGRLAIAVSKSIFNEGLISKSILSVGENVENQGEWIHSPLTLRGEGLKLITGSNPISGSVTLDADIEIGSSATIDGGWHLNFHTLTINSPNVLRVSNIGIIGGGELAGSGRLEITGDQTGSVAGTIAEVRLVNGLDLGGSLNVPRVVIEGIRSAQDIIFGGDLLLAPGARLVPRSSLSVTPRQVIINGSLVNRGTIENNNGRLAVTVTGDILNEGVIDTSSVSVAGDLTNDGTWRSSEVRLTAGGRKLITGPLPIVGSFVLEADIEIGHDATIQGAFALNGHTLEVNEPVVVTTRGVLGGTLTGSGVVEIVANQVGDFDGDIAEVRLVESGVLAGSMVAQNFLLSSVGGATRTVQGGRLTGAVEITQHVQLQNQGFSSTALEIEGSLFNRGEIRNSSAGGTFTLTVDGAVQNTGTIRNGRTLISGDITNFGAWHSQTEVFWPAVEGAEGYTFLITDEEGRWQSSEEVTTPFRNVTQLVDTSHQWRQRAVLEGQAPGYSEIHTINSDVRTGLSLVSPVETAKFREGDLVLLGWESLGLDPLAVLNLSMIRTSLPPTVLEPDGMNWVQLVTGTPNDGVEQVTIPAGITKSEDWLFVVSHDASGTSDASDIQFAIGNDLADLAVEIRASKDALYVGSSLRYDIAVINSGPDDAEEVAVQLFLPSFLEGSELTGCRADSTNARLCWLDNLAAGEARNVSTDVRLPKSPEGRNFIFATEVLAASATVEDPNLLNNRPFLETSWRHRPVFIIPGILGTHLLKREGSSVEVVWANGIKLFLTDDEFLKVLDLSDEPDDVLFVPGDLLRFPEDSDLDSYQGLFRRLEEAGYREQDNLIGFSYDWRLDLAQDITLLRTAIRAVRERTQTKVDIVAHSMGGLLTRLYAASVEETEVDSIIYLGVPHEGSTKAFNGLAFDDALTPSFVNVENVEADILSGLAKSFPSIYQLLPTYRFLKVGSDSTPLDLESTYVSELENRPLMVTTHLESYRRLRAIIDNDIRISAIPQVAIAGSGTPTLLGLKLTTKEDGDRCWILEHGNGDGTVLSDSAGKVFSNGKVIYAQDVEHAALPNDPKVSRFVEHLLTDRIALDESNDLPEGFSVSPGELGVSAATSTCSPVRASVSDGLGGVTHLDEDGSVVQGIPQSSFFILGEGEGSLLLRDKGPYDLVLRAEEAGTFTLNLSWVDRDVEVTTQTFADVPMASKSEAHITLRNENEEPRMLLDLDGDSETDFEILPGGSVDSGIFISVLIEVVHELRLMNGQARSLVAKLEAAMRAIDRGRSDAARGQLRSFVQEILAQRGKSLTLEEASLLLDLASRVLAGLS